MKATKAKFHPHVHLANLIQNRFGAHIELTHTPVNGELSSRNQPLSHITTAIAYPSIADAKKHENVLGIGRAMCVKGDRFERKVGATVALRRLYRDLAGEANKMAEA